MVQFVSKKVYTYMILVFLNIQHQKRKLVNVLQTTKQHSLQLKGRRIICCCLFKGII
jgi:hypothetical protein